MSRNSTSVSEKSVSVNEVFNEKEDTDEGEIAVPNNLESKPDGGYGWVILISAFLISFILDGIMYSFGKSKKKLKVNSLSFS